MANITRLGCEPRPYLPGGDGAEDVDDAVRLLLPLLGILLAKQSATAEKRAQARVTSRYRHWASAMRLKAVRVGLNRGLCLMQISQSAVLCPR